MKVIALIVASFLATALLSPYHASAWLIQGSASPTHAPPPPPPPIGGSATVVLAADNARNASGAPADTISSLTFPFPIMSGAMSEPERVVVFNTGGAGLTVSSITYSGANAADFSTAQTNCSGTLAAGSYCYIWANFAPKTTGAETATLNLNFANASASVPLSGTGEGGTVIQATCATLPSTLAADTYILPAGTCSGKTFNTSTGTVLQGDCTAPEGTNTIFDGGSSLGEITDGLANNTSNVTLRCITIQHYGNNGSCPPSASSDYPMFNMNTGWLLASDTIQDACGTGVIPHGGSSEIYDSRLTANPYTALSVQNASGTFTALGDEFDHNSNFVGTGDCNANYDCGTFKGVGSNNTEVFNGMYAHDNSNPGNATAAGANGAWCDGIGTVPENCATSWTIENSTIVNNNGDGIRAEVNANPDYFNHNVITGNQGLGGGQIVGACAENITANYNYIVNGTEVTYFQPVAIAGGGYEGRCQANVSAPMSLTANNNIIVMPDTWFQYGMVGGNTSGAFTVSSNNNKFYTASNGTDIAAFNDSNSGSGPFSWTTWLSHGHDPASTISTGLPPAVPSGCTGDGTYGIGCRGSGI